MLQVTWVFLLRIQIKKKKGSRHSSVLFIVAKPCFSDERTSSACHVFPPECSRAAAVPQPRRRSQRGRSRPPAPPAGPAPPPAPLSPHRLQNGGRAGGALRPGTCSAPATRHGFAGRDITPAPRLAKCPPPGKAGRLQLPGRTGGAGLPALSAPLCLPGVVVSPPGAAAPGPLVGTQCPSAPRAGPWPRLPAEGRGGKGGRLP